MPKSKYAKPSDLGSGMAYKAAKALESRGTAADKPTKPPSIGTATRSIASAVPKKTKEAKASGVYKTGKSSYSQFGSPSQKMSKNSAPRHSYKSK